MSESVCFPLQRLVLTVCLLLPGCSVFVVQDVHRVAGEESAFISHEAAGVELHVGINPDTRFYSFGMLGLPIIPTIIKPSDPTELALAIQLELRNDEDFSFASRPCLMDDESRQLCPHKVEASAVALYQDDGSTYADKRKRWNKIPSFYSPGTPILTISTTPESHARISRDRIYQHYGYFGDQKWGYLRVNVAYRYKCEGVCPKQFELESMNLVVIDNKTSLTKSYQFQKARETKYRFSTIVQ